MSKRIASRKQIRIVKIQPQEQENMTLPYPYFIYEKGIVGRQDFWKGKPAILLGFSFKPIAGTIELEFNDFWKKPKLALGMYPVFADDKDNWFTSKISIMNVEIL